jgi:hypothetical protein
VHQAQNAPPEDRRAAGLSPGGAVCWARAASTAA